MPVHSSVSVVIKAHVVVRRDRRGRGDVIAVTKSTT